MYMWCIQLISANILWLTLFEKEREKETQRWLCLLPAFLPAVV